MTDAEVAIDSHTGHTKTFFGVGHHLVVEEAHRFLGSLLPPLLMMASLILDWLRPLGIVTVRLLGALLANCRLLALGGSRLFRRARLGRGLLPRARASRAERGLAFRRVCT